MSISFLFPFVLLQYQYELSGKILDFHLYLLPNAYAVVQTCIKTITVISLLSLILLSISAV